MEKKVIATGEHPPSHKELGKGAPGLCTLQGYISRIVCYCLKKSRVKVKFSVICRFIYQRFG